MIWRRPRCWPPARRSRRPENAAPVVARPPDARPPLLWDPPARLLLLAGEAAAGEDAGGERRAAAQRRAGRGAAVRGAPDCRVCGGWVHGCGRGQERGELRGGVPTSGLSKLQRRGKLGMPPPLLSCRCCRRPAEPQPRCPGASPGGRHPPRSSRPDARPDPNSLLVVTLLAVLMVSDASPDGSALRVSRPSRRLGRRAFWGFLSRSRA